MNHSNISCQQRTALHNTRRGFVTIATGADTYYHLALNLLHSYKANGNCHLPFAIICDRYTTQTKEFDDTVILSTPNNSFLDKLYLYHYTPYDETIFIDADSLVLNDVNILWDDFSSMDDFSCYGQSLPLESRDGWFYYKDMGNLQPLIKYGVSLHGGIYYLRKTEQCKTVFEQALSLVDRYEEYKFYYFDKPADEPVLALSMALNGLKPCTVRGRLTFYITHENSLHTANNGLLMLGKRPLSTAILHFGTRNTVRFTYRYLLANIQNKLLGHTGVISIFDRFVLYIKCMPTELKYQAKQFVRKKCPKNTTIFLKKYLPKSVIRFLKR